MPFNTILQLMHLPDGGPVYAETDLGSFIVEPWNTVSAIFFVLIVIYWAYKLKKSTKRNSFLQYGTPILGIGGVGGTLYHAFRSSHYFLIMDYLPILLLCISAGVYFTFKAFPKKRYILLALATFVAAQYLTFHYLPAGLSTNVSYALLGLSILLPTFAWMLKTQFRYYYYVLLALLSFATALTCRIMDFHNSFLPMGTHWLWHSFGALACHLMFLYQFSVNEEVEIPEDIPHKEETPHEIHGQVENNNSKQNKALPEQN